MMNQFRVCRAIYAGYTRIYIMVLDADGYNVGEYSIRTEWNNISLRQSF